MTSLVIEFIKTFATTLLAAFIGSYLAFSKYKKEKIWQEKYNSYQEIFNSIFDMKLWASEVYCSCLCLPTISGRNDKQLYQEYVAARKCISKYISTGKLIISDDVAIKLDELNMKLWEEDFNLENEGDDNNYLDILSEHTSMFMAK